jgi:hypothetical protein
VRRRLLVAGLVVLVALAGCSSGGPTRAVDSGTAAAVDSGALEATGYEHTGTENRTLNTTVSATISGDVELNGERDVTATVPVASYRTETGEGPALFLVAASPAVRPIENQPVVRDPLATLDPAERANFLQSTYAVDSLNQGENVTATLLGNETAARTYAASTGQGEVTVRIASVRDGEEFVTVVAVTPSGAAEEERFRQLVDGVTH